MPKRGIPLWRQGFILQKLAGDGLVLVKGGGSIIKRTLEAGETMRLSPGCIVAFESSINFDVTMLSGAKNIIFGGEGLFLSTLTGPGTVWIQSLPFDRVVDSIAHQLGHGGYNPAMLAAMGMAGMGGSPPPTPSSTPGAGPTSAGAGADAAAAGAGAGAAEAATGGEEKP